MTKTINTTCAFIITISLLVVASNMYFSYMFSRNITMANEIDINKNDIKSEIVYISNNSNNGLQHIIPISHVVGLKSIILPTVSLFE